jgi:hypothetical protein
VGPAHLPVQGGPGPLVLGNLADEQPVVFFPLVGLDDEGYSELEDLVFS